MSFFEFFEGLVLSPTSPGGALAPLVEAFGVEAPHAADRNVSFVIVPSSSGPTAAPVAQGVLLSHNQSFSAHITSSSDIAVSYGDVFVAYALATDFFDDARVLCALGDSLLWIPLLHVHLGPGMTSLQSALRTSLEATVSGSVVVGLFTGDVSNDLASLAFAGLMTCATRGSTVSNSFGSLNILAPLLLYNTFTSVIYSNLLVLIVLGTLQVALVASIAMLLVLAPNTRGSRLILGKLTQYDHRRVTGEFWAEAHDFVLPQHSVVAAQTYTFSMLLSRAPIRFNISYDEASVHEAPQDKSFAVSLPDLCVLVKFPGTVMSGALSLYPGTLFAAIRLLQLYGAQPPRSGTPDAFDVSAGGLAVGVVFTVLLLPLPGVLYWLATRRIARSYHTFTVPLGESKRAYTAKYRLFTFLSYLEPRGRLFPSDASKTWGPLVALTRQHWLWTVSTVLSGWSMCVACFLQFQRSRISCMMIYTVLAAANVALGLAVLFAQPRRSPALGTLSALSLGVTGVVLAMSARTAFVPSAEMNNTAVFCLGVVQGFCSLLKSVAAVSASVGLKLHASRNAVMVTEWCVGDLSAEAVTADIQLRDLQRKKRFFKDDTTWIETCEGISMADAQRYRRRLLRALLADGELPAFVTEQQAAVCPLRNFGATSCDGVVAGQQSNDHSNGDRWLLDFGASPRANPQVSWMIDLAAADSRRDDEVENIALLRLHAATDRGGIHATEKTGVGSHLKNRRRSSSSLSSGSIFFTTDDLGFELEEEEEEDAVL